MSNKKDDSQKATKVKLTKKQKKAIRKRQLEAAENRGYDRGARDTVESIRQVERVNEKTYLDTIPYFIMIPNQGVLFGTMAGTEATGVVVPNTCVSDELLAEYIKTVKRDSLRRVVAATSDNISLVPLDEAQIADFKMATDTWNRACKQAENWTVCQVFDRIRKK